MRSLEASEGVEVTPHGLSLADEVALSSRLSVAECVIKQEIQVSAMLLHTSNSRSVEEGQELALYVTWGPAVQNDSCRTPTLQLISKTSLQHNSCQH